MDDEKKEDLVVILLAVVEELKQRQFEKILNMLTPHNVKDVSEQLLAVNIHSAVTLEGLVSQIFEKALMEPISGEIYANLCLHLATALPTFIKDNEVITVEILLINKLKNEFEKQPNSRSRRLGNIRLFGELYTKKFLTAKIVHICIKELLGVEDVEALCELMSIIGEMIDHPKAKKHMDAYFERMRLLSNNMKLSSRLRFMLKDIIDLRDNKWQIWYDAQPDAIASASAVSVKKYSRDFLLKLAEQCNELPEGFEIDANIAEEFMSVNVSSSHVHEANQRRLGELFSHMENLQCYVREHFDHIDTSIASLDYQMRSRFGIIFIFTMLFVLNILVMLYFFGKVRS